MSIAIRVENLSKEYHIANVKDRMGQDQLLSSMLFERKNGEKVLKALDNLSFEINKGESVAIIGRNGSGKSTLFKILSKITIPTTGTIKYMGKVASLLEVGSGLHPDLSARENIYFYGKILGMKKSDIANRFDDIVAFCGFEDFLDVQIKKHSIGMQLRLALSVAVHLDANILLFDEVLSVGDMEFQEIMIKKLRHITKKNNKTLLFISHDIRLLHEICDRGIVLNNGKMVYNGNIRDAIDFYKQMHE